MSKRIMLFVSAFALVLFAIFIVNQTAQLVSLANTISPVLARGVLSGLIAIYALAIVVPLVLLIRLPKPLVPPADEYSREYQTYLCQVGRRLATNTELICAGPLDSRTSIESALKVLDAKADDVIKRTASTLFVTTAVSQNGRLDALMVLAEQTRLIWRVAHVYNQRPTMREFGRLYANVGAAVFAARELDDLDVSEQIEPLIKAAVGGTMASLVPGIAAVASIVMNAVLDGTANAYLTLRVGFICQTYCRSITAVNVGKTRRLASIAAASTLGSIVSGSAASVVRAIVAAARKAGGSRVEAAAAGIRGAGAKLNPFKGPGEDAR